MLTQKFWMLCTTRARYLVLLDNSLRLTGSFANRFDTDTFVPGASRTPFDLALKTTSPF